MTSSIIPWLILIFFCVLLARDFGLPLRLAQAIESIIIILMLIILLGAKLG